MSVVSIFGDLDAEGNQLVILHSSGQFRDFFLGKRTSDISENKRSSPQLATLPTKSRDEEDSKTLKSLRSTPIQRGDFRLKFPTVHPATVSASRC